MTESLEKIKGEINYVISRTSINSPLYNNLITIKIECENLIHESKTKYYAYCEVE